MPKSINGQNSTKDEGDQQLDEIEKMMEQRRFDRKFKSRGIPKRFWELPELKKTEWNLDGFNAVESLLKGDIQGIFFVGKAGTGKTALACQVLTNLPEELSAKFVSVPILLNELRDGYSDKYHKNMDYVKKYVDYDQLVLDDLGAEKTTDWATEILYLIINGRYEEGKGVIVTTNCKPKELSARLGDRVISRLAEMTKLVRFDTDDDWRMLNWS